MIATARSQLGAWEKCPRLYYWQEVYDGGLDLDRSAAALNIGSAVHKAVETILQLAPPAETVNHAGALFEGLEAAQAAPEFGFLASEDDRDLVTALVRTWWARGLPALQGWQIEDVEREEVFDYPTAPDLKPTYPGQAGVGVCCVCQEALALWQSREKCAEGIHVRNFCDLHKPPTVRFQSRSDFIARALDPARDPMGRALNGLAVKPGLYNWNLKTWKSVDRRRRTALQSDAQVFTELLGPEARLGETFAGVIYQVLVKEDHPLVWAWRAAKSGEIVARYRWNCETAHENTHTKAGGWCPGGKQHRLGGDFERVAVRDLPGGQAAWFTHILETDPSLLSDFHVILGPMMRPSDYRMREWVETWLPRAAQLDAAAREGERLREVGNPEGLEAHLRREWPKHTAHGNCEWPFRCGAYSICHEGADPSAYPARVKNHPDGSGRESKARDDGSKAADGGAGVKTSPSQEIIAESRVSASDDDASRADPLYLACQCVQPMMVGRLAESRGNHERSYLGGSFRREDENHDGRNDTVGGCGTAVGE